MLKPEDVQPDLNISEKLIIIEDLRKQTSQGLQEVLSLIMEACDVPVAGLVFNDDALNVYQHIVSSIDVPDLRVEKNLKNILAATPKPHSDAFPWISEKDLVKIDPKTLDETNLFESACFAPVLDHKYRHVGGLVIADTARHLDLNSFQKKFMTTQASIMTRELLLRFALSREVDLHEKLNERTRMLRMILDNVPAKIWFKDNKNNIMRLNAKAARAVGKPIEEIEGKNDKDIWPTMAEQYCKEDKEVLKTGQPKKGIIQHYHNKNGTSGWVSTDKIPYTDEKTGKKFILLVTTDITKIRNYQKQISRDAERLELIGSSSNVGLWDYPIFDEDKIWWSAVYHKMMGDPDRKQKPSVEAFKNHIHPEDFQVFDQTLKKYMKDYRPFSVECRVKDQDSGYRWYLISGQSSSNPLQRNKRLIGSMTDINELKTIQLNYDIEREKLAEAYKELDRFAYVASHDLKAPLRGMTSIIEWIREDLRSGELDSTEEHLSLLGSRVDRMDMLLKDIDSFSRVGKTVTKAEKVNMNSLVENIIDWMPNPKSVDFEVGALPALTVQKTVAEQIFSNLISNAIKYNCSEKGIVKIACEETYFDYKFSVRDNGLGIEDEYRDIIFEPFKRLVAKDDVEGSGLGLSIVKKMVKSINGTVSIEPFEKGAGTCVSLTIPKIVS